MKDSHAIKFTGKAELEWPVTIDRNYTAGIQWSITNVSTSPNWDGSFSYVYSFRPIHVLIHDETWETIKAKDPRKNSEKLRSKIKHDWDRWLIGTEYREFDDCYDAFFRKMYEQYDFLTANLWK